MARLVICTPRSASTPGRSRQGMSFTGSSQEPASLLLPGDGLGPTGHLRELRAAPGTRRRARPITGGPSALLGLRRPSSAGRPARASAGGSGQLPRIRSAAFSASIIVGAWVALLGQSGITEASATASPSIPCTPIVSGSTTDSLVGAQPARRRRVHVRLRGAGDPVEDLLVGLDARPRPGLAAVQLLEGGLVEQVARDVHRVDPEPAVDVVAEVVELQRGLLARIRRRDLHGAPGGGPHARHHELVAPVGDVRVEPHRERREPEQQVRVGDLGVGADQPARLVDVRGGDARGG